MLAPIAVIDIGSNTIKLLVTRETSDGKLDSVFRKSLETRIGKGLNARNPIFPKRVISDAMDAVAELVREAKKFSPKTIRIVATNAVRDSGNRNEFEAAVLERAGIKLEVLSGKREAELIGKAIMRDPRLHIRDFYVFDLGGGSLEVLAFRNRKLQALASMPLGSVRIAEKCTKDPKAPFTSEDRRRIAETVANEFALSGFQTSLPNNAIAIGTGGTFTISLKILAALQGRKFKDLPLYLSQNDLRYLLNLVGNKSFSERLEIPSLTPGRADVFPTALSIVLKVLELCGQDGVHHSLCNLRYGAAHEMLEKEQAAPALL
ncbi:MAG TPA: hypothetical protein VK041_06960 [Opitutales bacterium]|nr:hypothetical protein [Opitutales bacterium]